MVREKLAQPDVRREARVRRRRETRPEGDRRTRPGQGRTPPVQDVRMQGLRAVTPAAVLRFRERLVGPWRLPAPMAGAEPMGLEPEAGLRPEHITATDLCTKCHADVFWSHRVTGGRRGSLAGFIAMEF